jgi:hypothetical protein
MCESTCNDLANVKESAESRDIAGVTNSQLLCQIFFSKRYKIVLRFPDEPDKICGHRRQHLNVV